MALAYLKSGRKRTTNKTMPFAVQPKRDMINSDLKIEAS